jgi:hypothetical protein
MDELKMVRDLFAEPAPPRPEVTAAARARLTAHRTRSRVRGRLNIVAPLGAAAAVTAVAVAVASLPHGPAAPAGRVTGRPPQAAQLTSGRYWVQPGRVGNYLRVGQPGHQYVVLEEVAVQLWTPQSKKLASPSISQALGVLPATPADERAWRAAGSPAVWPSVGQDTSLASPQGDTSGWLRPLKAGLAKPLAGGVGYGLAGFYWFGRQLSAAQLRAVTASPATLRQLLYKQYLDEGAGGGFASYLIWALPPLMTLPVTTAVRSALYQVLAGLPGVRDLGTRTFASQRGTALAVDGHWSRCGNEISLDSGGSGIRSTFSSCGMQQILIVSPVTWLPLAAELRYTSLPPGQSWSVPDGLFSYELFGTDYWTNLSPPVS